MPTEKGRVSSHDFLRFIRYVKPYAKYIVLAALGGIVKFCVPLLVPQVVRHLIDGVLLNQAMAAAQKGTEFLVWIFGMIGVFVFFYAPWTYVRHYYAGKAGHRSVFDLRCDLYNHILYMSPAFFDRNKTGEISTRLINDIPQAQNLVGNALTNIWMDGAAVVVILVFLLRIDLVVTLVTLSTFPVYIFFFRTYGGAIKASSYQVQKEIAEMSGNITEKIAGSIIVHAFTREKSEKELFYRDSEKLFSTTMKTVRLQSTSVSINAVLTQIAPLLVWLYTGFQVIGGRLTVGDFVAVGMYLAPLYLPFQRFAELNVIFANSMSSLRRIFEIMDERPEVVDRPWAKAPESVRGEVCFRNVSFGYDNNDGVLKNINFSARPGQKIAIVGPSGSGKSTLVSLIPRFYDLSGGEITVDGLDVRDLKLEALRRNIGIVRQEPVVFSGTVKENVLYGKPNASYEEFVAACRAANAYDFIQVLPNGFETEVGENGALLSGGQKQRLTIARAFIRDPRILILDEATSSLDAENERLIQDALDALMRNRTTLIIAHRLSTIVNADQILVLHQGTIVERGTHAELMRAGKVYKRLYRHQFELARLHEELLFNGEGGTAGRAPRED
jgi:ABC-type multidrug transport system fused ATPase/permease subunit